MAYPVCLIARTTPEFISRPPVLWRFMENDRLKHQHQHQSKRPDLFDAANLRNDLLPAVN